MTVYAQRMHPGAPPTVADRIRITGVIWGPAAFISAWAISGSALAGYSPIRDHISELSAVEAPTRTLMNVGFGAFAIGVGAASWPLRRIIGKPGAVALAVNAALSVGVMMAPLHRSPEVDRLHNVLAGLGYISLAVTGPLAVRTLAERNRALAALAAGVGFVTFASLVLSLRSSAESGLWQRVGLTTTDVWLMGMGLLAVAGRSEDARPAEG